jgi:hypothetical protein
VRTLAERLTDLYAALMRLYPRGFREAFGDEMRVVFADAVADIAERDRVALLGLCLRELRDWPRAALIAHWSRMRGRIKEVAMDTPGFLPVGGGPVGGLAYALLARHRVIQRSLDVILAICGLVITAPLLLLLTIAIRLDSPGPAIFRQRRLGKDGRPFTLYKLRSMIQGAGQRRAAVGAASAGGKDSRITRVGCVIRALRVDELPQLVNVVKGDMTILGPRPERL